MGKQQEMNLVKVACALVLIATIAHVAAVGSYPEEKMVEEFAPELELYTKFPEWVKTEEDMEQFFKLHKTKVVRKDTGNGGVNPSGRNFQAEASKQAPEPEVMLEVGKGLSDKQTQSNAQMLINELDRFSV